MEEANFYHALKIDNDRCIGCTHCMKECPTGAIRIRDGKALIHKDWCVDCGECLKSCPTEAIYVEQDDFQRIFDYKCRVALMPTVLSGSSQSTRLRRKLSVPLWNWALPMFSK